MAKKSGGGKGKAGKGKGGAFPQRDKGTRADTKVRAGQMYRQLTHDMQK